VILFPVTRIQQYAFSPVFLQAPTGKFSLFHQEGLARLRHFPCGELVEIYSAGHISRRKRHDMIPRREIAINQLRA
jgi:hypothetical protein